MKTRISALFATALLATGVQAAPMGFTNIDSYLSALMSNGLTETVEGFDSFMLGTVASEGENLNDFTFSNLDLAGSFITVEDYTDDTPSNFNALGTDAGGAFGALDGFDVTFSGSQAFGLFISTIDFLADGDITLTVGGVAQDLVADDVLTPAQASALGLDYDPFSLDTFFIGFIDPTDGFAGASLTSTDANGAFTFTLDDFRTATAVPTSVPAVGPIALIIPGLFGLAAIRRRA